MKHPGARRPTDNRAFNEEDVENPSPGENILQQPFMDIRGNVGERRMPKELYIKSSKKPNYIRTFTA